MSVRSRRSRRRRPGGDDGSGTVLVLGVAAAALAVTGALATVAQAALAQADAAATADAAALAAADVLAGRADGQPCDRAQDVAGAASAVLLRCDADDDPGGEGDAVRVEVGVRPGGPAGLVGLARARARAGPAPQD